MIAKNAAVSAQGNFASTGSGVFCGGLSIGADDQEISTKTSDGTLPEQFCNDNRSANSQNPGYLYVGDSVDVKNTISATDGHFDSKLQVGDSSNPAGYMVLNGTLDVMDTLIASDGDVSMKNLIVQDAAQINKSLKVLEKLKLSDQQQ